MIIDSILQAVLAGFNALISWLPQITTLPTIAGYDIDGALVSNIGYFYTFAKVVWPVYDVLLGAFFIWTIHFLLMFLRLILGHRAPQMRDN